MIQILWDGKWFITAFVVIAISLGSGFLYSKEPLYESKLVYSVDTLPPFYSKEKALTDFKKRFYSSTIFKDWKKSNANTPLVFKDFSLTEVVNGFVLSRREGEQLATISSEKGFILLKTNQLPVLDGFFKYSEYVNRRLKREYVERAKDELNIIETRFEDFSTGKDVIISRILAVDRFIVAVGKGEDVLKIQSPTKSNKAQKSIASIFANTRFVVSFRWNGGLDLISC